MHKKDVKLGIGFALLLVFSLALVGCCSNPGVFDQVKKSEQTIQSAYYTASGNMNGIASDQYVALGGMAADLALGLAGQLQTQWCPNKAAADALAAQVNALPLVQK